MNELQIKYKKQIEEMIEACRRSGALGYGAGSGGNASYRVDENVVLITPTGIVKRKIVFEDICIIDMKANPLYIPENRKPTGEYFMHLHVYEKRPDVNAVFHAHPPILIGMSLAEESAALMSKAVLPDAATMFGPILTIPYVRPNGDELGYSFDPYIMKSNAFIMSNHGCLVCSKNGISGTVDECIVMEAQAKVVLVSKILNDTARVMNARDMVGLDQLLAKREEVMPCNPGNCEHMAQLFADNAVLNTEVS